MLIIKDVYLSREVQSVASRVLLFSLYQWFVIEGENRTNSGRHRKRSKHWFRSSEFYVGRWNTEMGRWGKKVQNL